MDDFWRTFEDHALFLRYIAKRHGHYPEVAWLDQTLNTNPATLAKFYAEWREKSEEKNVSAL